MLDYYFTFRTLTAGQRGARILEQVGIYPRLIRAPKAITAQGCGYALAVPEVSGKQAAQLLRSAASQYGASYQLMADGTLQAVQL